MSGRGHAPPTVLSCQAMTRWDYKVVNVAQLPNYDAVEALLKELGREGWDVRAGRWREPDREHTATASTS